MEAAWIVVSAVAAVVGTALGVVVAIRSAMKDFKKEVRDEMDLRFTLLGNEVREIITELRDKAFEEEVVVRPGEPPYIPQAMPGAGRVRY